MSSGTSRAMSAPERNFLSITHQIGAYFPFCVKDDPFENPRVSEVLFGGERLSGVNRGFPRENFLPQFLPS